MPDKAMPRARRQGGNVAIEAALIAPLFFMLIGGIVHFGLAVFSYNVLTAAVRDGARYAIVHGSSSAAPATAARIQEYVQGRAVGLNQSQVRVTTTWTPDKQPGSMVQVRAQYAPPGLWNMLPGSVSLASVSQMVICR